MLRKILVWDIPIRVFHWALVVCIVFAWFSVEILEDMEQHFYAGYTALSLLLFRFVWGFVGSRYARFSNFLYSPFKIVSYAKSLLNKETTPYLGHNPLGGLSVFAMLAVLIFQTGTGLFSSDDYYFGPLAGLIDESWVARLTNLHHLNFDLITVLIVVHIIAIAFYRFRKKEHLVGAMFHGKKFHGKKLHEEDQKNKKPINTEPAIMSSKLLLAVFIFALCVAVVYLLANSFTDTLPSVEDYYS